jgi:hypothetical protein
MACAPSATVREIPARWACRACMSARACRPVFFGLGA